ncbi:LuxR C-terminal-related transcriptional regulator [Novosphingobium malaysiense]|uniref:LuxR family transcriptional regulator n=1 Tax=Novosphingobium malaysiense TaxID=1348853 RepID=A0A0B1ZP03_9SPHN|nr:response regulator transcription factor [Novosphingobium malaysiense]KHK92880.1 hypothetical protein LK12_00235 [Novosphingobium malaysiense]
MFKSVCLVCENDLERQGLYHFLKSEEFDVICSASGLDDIPDSLSGDSFLAVIDVPDIEQQRGAVEDLKQIAPNAVTVILTENFDVDAMVGCFQSGARGYIVKSKRSEPLMIALRLVALGEMFIPPNLAEALNQRPQLGSSSFSVEKEKTNPAPELSPREHDVLCCLMAGYPNKSIARQLDVCEATVKVHVKAILRKLKVRNRTQAAIWASSNGIHDTRLAC